MTGFKFTTGYFNKKQTVCKGYKIENNFNWQVKAMLI